MIFNTTLQNTLDAIKAALRENFIVLSSCIGGKGKLNVMVSTHIRNLKKEIIIAKINAM